MSTGPDEFRSWDEPGQDPEQALDDLRRGLERAREQVRTYRRVLRPEQGDDA